MNKLIIISFFTALFLTNCTSSSLDGQYIKIKSNDRGNSLNVFDINLVKEINFGNSMCRFNYFGTTMSGKYKIEGDYVYIDAGGEIGTLSMQITDNGQTLEGEGWISGTFRKMTSYVSKNKPAIGFYRTTSKLNIRTGPGTEYFKIETVDVDQELKVIQIIDGDWCEIEYKNYSGFVSKKFLVEKN